MKLYFVFSSVIFSWLLCACAQARESVAVPATTHTPPEQATATIVVSPTATATPTPQPTVELAVLSPANISQIQQVSISEGDDISGRLVWSADGQRLLILSEYQVFLMDAYTTKIIWAKDLPFVSYGSFAPDGKEIVLATLQTLFFVDARTGEDLRQVTCSGNKKFLASPGGFRGVNFSPDWQKVVYAYEDSDVWGDSYVYVTTPAQFCSPRLLQKQTLKSVYNSAFSKDSNYFMAQFSHRTVLWKILDPERYVTDANLTAGNTYLSSDRSKLFVNDGSTISVFDIDTLQPITSFRYILDDGYTGAIDLNPDGTLLVMWDDYYKNTVIKLWDTKTGEVLQAIKDLPGSPRSLSFSPDGRLLAILLQQPGDELYFAQIGFWGVKK